MIGRERKPKTPDRSADAPGAAKRRYDIYRDGFFFERVTSGLAGVENKIAALRNAHPECHWEIQGVERRQSSDDRRVPGQDRRQEGPAAEVAPRLPWFLKKGKVE